MLALEAFPERRCSSCTTKNKETWGCDKDTLTPLKFDGEKLFRCPLRPYKDDPQHYSELFKLYSFREKSILPEAGAYYDQPNYYVEMMLEMDSAIADRHDIKEVTNKEKLKDEDKKVDELRNLGFNIVKKQ